MSIFPRFTFNVPRMHSVSEMYDTVRCVCPALAKQSCLCVAKKTDYQAQFNESTDIRQWKKDPATGKSQPICKFKHSHHIYYAEFLSRLFAHYYVSNCLVKAELSRTLPLGLGIYVKFVVYNRLITRLYDKLKYKRGLIYSAISQLVLFGEVLNFL